MTRHAWFCAGLLVAVTTTQAASFDCGRARTEVEILICGHPELSRLDEQLGEAYEAARKSAADPEVLKAEQLAWLAERNDCADADCLERQYQQRIGQLKAYPDTRAGKPRYRLAAGKGYSICETYLKHLNALPPNAPPIVCNVRPNPAYNAVTRDDWDITQPEWEELDVSSNLELVYHAELQLPPYYKYQYKYREPPEPFPSFEEWKADFDARIAAGKIRPRLYRTRLALNERGPETLIGYEPDPDECRRGLQIGYVSGDGPHVFVRSDDPAEPLKVIRGALGSDFQTTILLYRGSPYFAWEASEDPETWGLGLSTPFSAMDFDRPKEYVLDFRCDYHFDK